MSALILAMLPALRAEPQTAGLAPATTARLLTSPEAGWPQWRGPRRDGICDEIGLLQQWPAGGPRLRWKISGLGRGYAAPVITGGRLFVSGDVGNDLQLSAFDLTGKLVWRATNGLAWKGPYPGARASCAYREGRLFHLNAHGRVACLDPESGRELWAVDVLERFGGKNITWGLSECLLVDGRHVIVTAGGTQALMVALDVASGESVWKSAPLLLGRSEGAQQQRVAEPAGEADSASYASPILFTLAGRRHIVNCSLRHVFGVDAETGELLWTRPLPTRYSVIAATPVLCGNAVFVTAPDAGGGRLHRLRVTDGPLEVEEAWTTPLDTNQGGLVYVDGLLYGSWYRSRKGWACIDIETGALRYEATGMPMGPVLYADRRLYWLSQEGEMTLLNPTPGGFAFAGRFRLVPEKENDVWAHPVILDGRLYLRHQEQLWCYDVRAH